MDDLDGMFSAFDGIGKKANAMVGLTKMGGPAAGNAAAPATKKGSVPKKPSQGGKGGGKDKDKKPIPSAREMRDAALIHEFNQIDTNGDGSLSIDELFEGLQRRCWEQDEISVLFTKLDANRDGLISLEEFLVGMKGGKLLSMASFIPFADFKRHGRIPRRGHKEDFVHPATGQTNTNLCRPRSTFDEKSTVFYFVSHRWLSPGGAEGHPDNQDNSKFELIVEAVDKIMDSHPMLGEECQAAIWIDFGCVDQDLENPADELNELHEIIAQCDVLLTPVHDPAHAEWELPTTVMDWYKEYKADAFQEYWRRAWCVVEAMSAACMPVWPSGEERGASFRADGAVGFAILQNRRPHIVFGTKEKSKGMQPRFFPPLLHSNLAKYDPARMELTSEGDRATIVEIAEGLRKYILPLKVGWEGGTNARGAPEGRGKYTLENGDVYEGGMKDGEKHGEGCKFKYASGTVYEGAYEDGKKNGKGSLRITSGGGYEGDFKDDMMSGKGKYRYTNGDVYVGCWKENRKSGSGKMEYSNGDVYDGEWKSDKKSGQGAYHFANGGVYIGGWKEDQKFGKGKMTHRGGEVEEGMWEAGVFKG